jgi:hypothetical protein
MPAADADTGVVVESPVQAETASDTATTEPVRKSVVLSESEQLKPETLVSGMVNEWLSTTQGKIIAVIVLLVIGFLLGSMR